MNIINYLINIFFILIYLKIILIIFNLHYILFVFVFISLRHCMSLLMNKLPRLSFKLLSKSIIPIILIIGNLLNSSNEIVYLSLFFSIIYLSSFSNSFLNSFWFKSILLCDISFVWLASTWFIFSTSDPVNYDKLVLTAF